MKKLSVSLIALIFAIPSFATGIGAGADSAGCNNGVLGTYTGPTNLNAQWTANRITLNWYDDSTENGGQTINVSSASNACTYDGGITLPNDPEKTGYEFSGWKVRRAAAAPSCSGIACFDLMVSPTKDGGIGLKNNQDYCRGWEIPQNDDDYYVFLDCSNTFYSDMARYEWKAIFDYGTIKGTSSCASNYNGTAPTGSGNRCWCKITDIDGVEQSLPWVYIGYNNADMCAESCATHMRQEGYRVTMYGLQYEVASDCTSIHDSNACILGRCKWSTATSACYDREVDDCSTIVDEHRCEGSYQDSSYVCRWDGESCYEYYDD